MKQIDFETNVSKIYSNEEGFVIVEMSFKDITMDKCIEHYATMRENFKNDKFNQIYIVKDIDMNGFSKEIRTYSNAQVAPNCKSIAIISNSSMLMWFFNFYIGLANFPFPIKVVSNMEEAQNYSRQYI